MKCVEFVDLEKVLVDRSLGQLGINLETITALLNSKTGLCLMSFLP